MEVVLTRTRIARRSSSLVLVVLSLMPRASPQWTAGCVDLLPGERLELKTQIWVSLVLGIQCE